MTLENNTNFDSSISITRNKVSLILFIFKNTVSILFFISSMTFQQKIFSKIHLKVMILIEGVFLFKRDFFINQLIKLYVSITNQNHSFRKNEITNYKEQKKKFDKSSDLYYKCLQSNLALSHKKKEQVLKVCFHLWNIILLEIIVHSFSWFKTA